MCWNQNGSSPYTNPYWIGLYNELLQLQAGDEVELMSGVDCSVIASHEPKEAKSRSPCPGIFGRTSYVRTQALYPTWDLSIPT
jgi:hypothetical protein